MVVRVNVLKLKKIKRQLQNLYNINITYIYYFPILRIADAK